MIEIYAFKLDDLGIPRGEFVLLEGLMYRRRTLNFGQFYEQGFRDAPIRDGKTMGGKTLTLGFYGGVYRLSTEVVNGVAVHSFSKSSQRTFSGKKMSIVYVEKKEIVDFLGSIKDHEYFAQKIEKMKRPKID